MNTHLPKLLRTKKSRKLWNHMCKTYEKAYKANQEIWDKLTIDRNWTSI